MFIWGITTARITPVIAGADGRAARSAVANVRRGTSCPTLARSAAVTARADDFESLPQPPPDPEPVPASTGWFMPERPGQPLDLGQVLLAAVRPGGLRRIGAGTGCAVEP